MRSGTKAFGAMPLAAMLAAMIAGAAPAQEAPAAEPATPIQAEPPAAAVPAEPVAGMMQAEPPAAVAPAEAPAGALQAEPPAAGVPAEPVAGTMQAEPPAETMQAEAPAGPMQTEAPAGAMPAGPSAGGAVPGPMAEGAAPPPAGPGVGTLPHGLSPWGMFVAADVVVKAVMIGLAVASLVTWTVFVAKTLEIAAAKARLRRGLRSILAAGGLGELAAALGGRGGPASLMAGAAWHEVEASGLSEAEAGGRGLGTEGLLDRVGSHLARIEARAGRRLMVGTGVLATIGATAPFVGLFGTVWGIMNSFIGISESHTTNLAVVAPGIAEALLATALGLVAAIPAVVIYNHFARSIAGYRATLADAAAGIERLVSRDLDLGRLAAAPLRRAAE